jgi:hypothetical protein
LSLETSMTSDGDGLRSDMLASLVIQRLINH